MTFSSTIDLVFLQCRDGAIHRVSAGLGRVSQGIYIIVPAASHNDPCVPTPDRSCRRFIGDPGFPHFSNIFTRSRMAAKPTGAYNVCCPCPSSGATHGSGHCTQHGTRIPTLACEYTAQEVTQPRSYSLDHSKNKKMYNLGRVKQSRSVPAETPRRHACKIA